MGNTRPNPAVIHPFARVASRLDIAALKTVKQDTQPPLHTRQIHLNL